MSRRKPRSLAELADVHELYEEAVQNVAEQCRFVDSTYKEMRGCSPAMLCEDFCGTASAACEWVVMSRSHRAVGIDIDRAVLRWARRHRLAMLGKAQRRRIALIRGDVREVRTPPADAVTAFNFSYWIFRRRAQLRRYFEAVRARLAAGGIFFLDAYGGYAAMEELEEAMDLGEFTYLWEQARYNPVTGYMRTHIHFEFPDGSRIRKAFSYQWRLWTLPEIRELLLEAGFHNPTVYSELMTDDGDGTGLWLPVKRLPASRAWIVNITAEK